LLLLILAEGRGSWPGGVPFADDPVRSAGNDGESNTFTTAAQPIAASRCSYAPTGFVVPHWIFGKRDHL
jgi:hypothetical protein